MKKLILIVAIIFSLPAFFYSCKKETLPAVAPPPIDDSLSGKELVIDDLAWKIYYSVSPDWDEIYLLIPSTPNVNRNTIAKAELFLKYDTSANWIQVVRQSEAVSGQPVYLFNYENLAVEVYPLNYQLPGRKSSVKVKFL